MQKQRLELNLFIKPTCSFLFTFSKLHTTTFKKSLTKSEIHVMKKPTMHKAYFKIEHPSETFFSFMFLSALVRLFKNVLLKWSLILTFNTTDLRVLYFLNEKKKHLFLHYLFIFEKFLKTD